MVSIRKYSATAALVFVLGGWGAVAIAAEDVDPAPPPNPRPVVVQASGAGVSLPLSVLATMPAADPAAGEPAPAIAEADRKFVKDTLATIDATDPATEDKVAKDLIAKGESIVPAMREALPNATGPARKAIEAALAQLAWKVDAAKLVRQWAAKETKDENLRVSPVLVGGESLTRAFPAFCFYLVAFRQYPVAMMPPEPLASRNLFAVSREGKVHQMTHADRLKKFFVENLPAVREDADARKDVVAWLTLSREIVSDGFFKFTIGEDTVRVAKSEKGWEAAGSAVAGGAGGPKVGDRGTLSATMTFDEKGKLKDVKQEVDLRPGIRPICQTTKLLDPDPIVRKMAERDLLVMGTAAREYIFDQRAKASPELRKAIDEIWQQIVEREKD